MDKEQWGTLSIFDHREPLFLRSLVFFDRTVMPVPTQPMYDITEEEIERLTADAEYLEAHDAAVIHPWDSEVFQDWQHDLIREVLTVRERDSLYDSRLMLQELAPDDVVATPVYGARQGYEEASRKIENVPVDLLTLELTQRLSVPDADVPLSEIVELRSRPSFQSALRGLRKWRLSVLPNLIADPGEGAARAAGRDLDRMMSRYEEAMADSRMKKRRACVVSVLALGAAVTGTAGMMGILAAAAPTAFAVSDSMKPFWKEVRDTDFAAAGVLYEAQEVLDRLGSRS